MAEVSASLLGCDRMRIGQQVLAAEQAGVQYLHVDVMDGRYVENLAFCPQTVTDLRKICSLPVAVHLEVCHPESIVPLFLETGADIITFQLDACPNPIHLLQKIRNAGKEAGIGIGPAYGVEGVRHILRHFDRLTLMSVEPGYGGQVFEESIYGKIRDAKDLLRESGARIPISVDGGVDLSTAPRLLAQGADVLISGSYLFGADIRSRARSLVEL